VDVDLGTRLDRLCSAATHDLRLSGVAVTLMTRDGFQAVAGASDGSSRALEELQFALGEGPGCDAFASGRPVLVPDLESAFVRWPGYVPAGLRLGTCAAYTFPLQLGAMRFGVITFYAEQPSTLGAPELTLCMIFAEIATEFLLDSSSAPTEATADTGVGSALHFRTEIYQAQGMVMVALEVTLVEALARMRAVAFSTGQDLRDLALGIIAGSIQLTNDKD
jgi:GAF domain-containing protein/ANTAR domain-containing protein